MQALPKLMFISDGHDSPSQLKTITQALEGGVKWVQLRAKDWENYALEQLALRAQELCAEFGALLSLNDHVELAVKILADGIHVGKNDMPLKQAKQLVGENLILGATANTLEDLKNAAKEGADYAGLGPFRFTSTKKNLSPILGIQGYRSLVQGLKNENLNLPVYAIGGIRLEDIDELLHAGVFGIAVSSAISKTHSPALEAEKWVKKLS